MNKLIVTTVLSLFSLLIAFNSSAASNTPTGVISYMGVADLVQAELKDGNGNKIPHNPDGCANDTDIFILIKDGNLKYDDLFRALMFAKGSNFQVKLYIDGCHALPNGKIRPSIS